MTSLRKLRKKAHAKVNDRSWDTNDTRMYFIRHIKPCPDYYPWCGDCNAALFPKEMGRFPYSIQDFNDFEARKQEGQTP